MVLFVFFFLLAGCELLERRGCFTAKLVADDDGLVLLETYWTELRRWYLVVLNKDVAETGRYCVVVDHCEVASAVTRALQVFGGNMEGGRVKKAALVCKVLWCLFVG